MILALRTLSIITPVLNAGETLERTIRSVAPQKTCEIEYIVVDGGSTDASREIIDRNEAIIDKLVSEPDRGIAHAMNKGIALASGAFIGLLNADDVYQAGALQKILAIIDRDPRFDVLYGDVAYYDPANGDTFVRHSNLADIAKYMSLFHPAMFVRREAYQNAGGYAEDYKLAMDSEWVHRALALGLQFEHVPAVLATMSLGGVSHVNYRAAFSEFMNSALSHGLISPLRARAWWLRQVILHTLLKSARVRRSWQAIGRIVRQDSKQ